MSIFSKIIKGDIPSHKVFENDAHLAFLDINPLKKGHTLVIPKKEVDYIFDLEPQELAALHKFAQRVAKGMDKATKCERIGVSVIGLEVPHAHIHLIPIDGIHDMDFSNPKLTLKQEEMAKIASEINTSIV